MNGVTVVALVLLCFAGGYILVSAVFRYFEKPKDPPKDEGR